MKRKLLLIILPAVFTLSALAQPTADFSYVANCTQVTFTDLSTCNGCTIIGWDWDFGSGTSSTQQNPVEYLFMNPAFVTLSVTDNNLNVTTVTHTVNTNSGTLAVGFSTVSNPSGCGMCDGSITATASGGTSPYSYFWSPLGQATHTITDACAGLYNVRITDAQGCVLEQVVTITDPTAPIIVEDTVVHINCFDNNSSGMIDLLAAGGSGNYTYSWAINGTIISTSPPPLTGIQEGTYSVAVTDANGCTGYADFTILNQSNLYLSMHSINANCAANGSATVTAAGLHPPFAYAWNDLSGQTTQTASGLGEGTYAVEVTDTIGCMVSGTVFIDSVCLNVISGRVYLDTNQNCLQDIGEPGVAYATVHAVPGDYYALTDTNGDYALHTPEINNIVDVPVYNQFSPSTCPPSGMLNVNFTQLGDTLFANNFGYEAEVSEVDLIIHPGWSAAHPGFDKQYWIYYYNASLFPVNALIRFEYDPALTYLSSTQGGTHYPAQHAVEWIFPQVPHSWTWDWNTSPRIYFNVPVGVNITDSLCSFISINPIAGDLNPADNMLSICEPVTGSHDPNAKDVIPKGDGPQGFILPTDSVLFYTIHFQNDGNDTAFTVVIKDTLSSYLNGSTFIPGAASHPYTYSLTGQGAIAFRFDQIMLPDSNINEPASHGYVNYTVKLKPNLPPATAIENTAHIFFDFNEAVVTNTTVNTIASPVGILELRNTGVSVFPNPASDLIVVESGILKGVYRLSDVTGKTLLQGNVLATKFSLDISSFSSGVYFISITAGEKQVNGKVVKE